jgi:hypothetical protein
MTTIYKQSKRTHQEKMMKPHYDWQWADTFHGGRNIDIFEGREHIATVFTEGDAKRIIMALKYNPQVENGNKKSEDIVLEIIRRIQKQPELENSWNGMANAEKNYFVGDIFNLVNSNNPQAERELWCGNCGFKESETCNDETTWKRCRLMSSEPEGKNIEARIELARQSEREKVLGVIKVIENECNGIIECPFASSGKNLADHILYYIRVYKEELRKDGE